MEGYRFSHGRIPLSRRTGPPFPRNGNRCPEDGYPNCGGGFFSFSEGRVPHNRGTVVALSEGEGALFRRKGSFFRVTCSPVPWDACPLIQMTGPPILRDGSPVSDVWVPRSPRNATPFSHGRQPLYRGTGNPLTCEARIRNPFLRKNEVLPVVRRCASTCGRRNRTPSRDP